MSNNTEKVYFQGLYGLRFVAAAAVVISHIEQIKLNHKYFSLFNFPVINNFGFCGVILFFVLSGFLITYLLLAEKENKGTISVKKFYIRRILRIWPVYFLIIALSFFIIPYFSSFFEHNLFSEMINQKHFLKKLGLSLIFLPHIAIILFPPLPCGQIWTIGLEEQFYLLWPMVIKFFKKYLLFTILMINLFFVAVSYYVTNINNNFLLSSYFSMLKLDCMVVGAIGAYILFFKKDFILKILFGRLFQLLLGLILFYIIYFQKSFGYITNEVYSILFIIFIINISSNPKSIIKLENRALKFLGKISYGIYMYQFFAIEIALNFTKLFFHDKFFGFGSNLTLYLSTFAILILISAISYIYFENFFLKLKSRFSIINSGD